MKKTFVIIAALLFTANCFSREQLANEDIDGLYVKSIEQVLRLEPKEIDLATAALITSEQWSDLVHGRRYLSQLDDMALEILGRIKKRQPNYKTIKLINKYLFEELEFQSVDKPTDPNDLFLHSVLDRKRGYCLSLSILYLSLAERLGLPLYGVVVPGHFFVRYDDGRVRFNIETTAAGANADDQHYIEKFKVPQANDNIYMTNLNKLQTLGCFFNNLGNSYSGMNDIDTAFEVLERAVEINPSLAECRTNLANIYLRTGKINDAIYQYNIALEINPNDSKAHHNLGNAYIKQDRIKDAIEQYSQSIDLDANFIDAYRNLASAYTRQQLFGQAEAQIRRALTIEPKNTDCLIHLADIYQRTDNLQKAISQYEKALKIKFDLAKAHFGLALCYNKLEKSDDEIHSYKQALAIEPDMTAALVNLGNAYFRQDNYAAAIEYYRKASRITPDDPSIFSNLAAAYFNKTDYKQAAAEYLSAIELDPEMADAHKGLALAFYNIKKYQLALKYLKKAEQLGAEIDGELLDTLENKINAEK